MKQSRTRLSQFLVEYPHIAQLRTRFAWKSSDGLVQYPTTRVRMQRADPEMMHMQGRDMPLAQGGWVSTSNKQYREFRGIRREYAVAVGEDDKELATLLWQQGDFEKKLKHIFPKVKPSEVRYLLWVAQYYWYKPTIGGSFPFDVRSGIQAGELEVIVFLPHKDLSFVELIDIANRQEQERKEAYKYPPAHMPKLTGIQLALEKGCTVRAFLSGGGLRVVRVEKDDDLRGYGESPHVEEALLHANEDYLAGGREYKEVYGHGKKYTHYLTGSSLSTSNIDSWVAQGNSFLCRSQGERIFFQLKGTVTTIAPKELQDSVLQSGKSASFESRGYTYRIIKSKFPNEDPCVSVSVVGAPKSKNKGGADPWLYKVTKTGHGDDFWSAMLSAFDAPEVEIPRD